MIPRFTDHAANERTYLAWVRTAITVMAFGFLIERFDIFLAYVSRGALQAMPVLHVRASEWLGLVLILFGAFTILLATIRFKRNRRAIASDESFSFGGSFGERALSWLLILIAVFLVGYVARQVVALS